MRSHGDTVTSVTRVAAMKVWTRQQRRDPATARIEKKKNNHAISIASQVTDCAQRRQTPPYQRGQSRV